MAKKYLEMGINSKAIKTTDLDHLRKCKIRSKVQKLTASTTLLRTNQGCEYKINNITMIHQKIIQPIQSKGYL